VVSTTPVHIAGSFNSTSQQATLTLVPLAATMAVTLTAGASPSAYGAPVTFMATVSGNGPAATGSVLFYDGGSCSTPGATLGSAVALNGSAQASITTSALTAVASPHTILACYSGDVNYTPNAGTLVQALNPATVTPSITANSKVSDGTTTATIATRSLSGVIGTDDVTPSGGTATFADKNVGTAKTVTATGLTLSGTAVANYQLSSTPATTTANITAAPLTVTAANASRSYGAANPVFTGTLIGVQNNDNITATFSTAATISSPPGPYAIVPALVDPGNNLGNYTVTANNGVLTITPLAVAAVSLNPAAVIGGTSAQGTVSLTGPAPSGGLQVTLSSGNPSAATVLGSVTVPAGSTSATFTVNTVAVSSSTSSIISASYNSVQKTATLRVNSGSPISPTGWSVIADSQETSCYNGAAANAVDGNPSTLWVTQFCGGTAAMAHHIDINLGAPYSLTAFQYLARQDGCANGWIKDYQFYVSTDGTNWTLVASGKFNYGIGPFGCGGAPVLPAFQVAFAPTTGQYIRLQALSEINGGPWTAVAEIGVVGTFAGSA
jgi:hypothetical protein